MPKSILIVDDDKLIRKVLRSFVESRTHFEICGEAVNGLEAIEKARTLNPDLIVMDLSMPVMNGLEAGSILKAMLPKVPIVMYTAHDSAAMKVQALAAGVRAVVQKHDIDGLAGHLHELLE
jgi:DNA-binding NarL/FixJ family response regulator